MFFNKLKKNLENGIWNQFVNSNKIKLKAFMLKRMINPTKSRRVQIFKVIVSIAFYIDFFLTGFILSNYEFLNSDDPDNNYFLNHENYFSESNESKYSIQKVS